MEFYKKYRHVGFSHPSVPEPWKPIVQDAIIKIEKLMWPRWIPMFIKRWIHYLATDNSVVRLKYKWAYKLRTYLTGGSMINQIKDKYAEPRIYLSGTNEMFDIVDEVEKICSGICENCGSTDDVQITGEYWIYNLCKTCRDDKK